MGAIYFFFLGTILFSSFPISKCAYSTNLCLVRVANFLAIAYVNNLIIKNLLIDCDLFGF